jgi:radical SAM protein with 4Fe4S-binding SPASM domain
MILEPILAEKKFPFCHLFLALTQECNARCRHCYLGGRLGKPISFTLEEAKRVMSYFSSLGTSRITFLGGEPTLHRNFIALINEAYDIGLQVIVDTNGLFSKKLLNKVKNDRITYFNFSLDGSKADLHERIRGTGTFSKCVDNIVNAKKSGFNVGIVDTITSINILDVPDMIELAKTLEVALLNFHKLTLTGCARKISSKEVKPNDWIDVTKVLEKSKPPKLPVILYPPSYSYVGSMKKYLDKGYKGCIARNYEKVSVYPDGSAYLCTLMLDDPLNFAILNKGKLLTRKEYSEIDLVNSLADCKGCRVLEQCGGYCGAFQMNNKNKCNFSNSDLVPLCNLWKTTV